MQNILAESRRILLRPINQSDIEVLCAWRNSERFLSLCSIRRNSVDLESFMDELDRDFQKDRHVQCVIELKRTGELVGTIFSYNFRAVDGYAFVTIFIADRYEGYGYGAEAFILFLHDLFTQFPLHKIYFENM